MWPWSEIRSLKDDVRLAESYVAMLTEKTKQAPDHSKCSRERDVLERQLAQARAEANDRRNQYLGELTRVTALPTPCTRRHREYTEPPPPDPSTLGVHVANAAAKIAAGKPKRKRSR